ncbi:MAG: hypothetical protein LBV29_01360 [Azoarcus sp.]|jgi:hypothetical protein|nr:hypothetical protein [Azoarcus sp.]
MPSRILYPIGYRFEGSKLTVIENIGNNKHGQHTIRCICDCGEEWVGLPSRVKRGVAKSCGCTKKLKKGVYPSKHPLYRVYLNIKRKCIVESLTICDSWRKDHNAFISYCLSNGWRSGFVTCRINDSDGFRPGNMMFCSRKEYFRNKRNLPRLSINGETKAAVEWAEMLGITRQAMFNRFNRGWSPDSLLVPSKRKPKKHTGVMLHASDHSENP